MKSFLKTMGKRLYRNKVVYCFYKNRRGKVKSMMQRGTGHIVDWKWEYMDKRFNAIARRLPHLEKDYDHVVIAKEVGRDSLVGFEEFKTTLADPRRPLAGRGSLCGAVTKVDK